MMVDEDAVRALLAIALDLSQRFAPEIARTYRLHYEELRKQGFTEEQAILLVSRMQILQSK